MKIEAYINSDIKAGDTVKVVDGSFSRAVNSDVHYNGIDKRFKKPAKVVVTGLDYMLVEEHLNLKVILDVIVQVYDGTLIRTCSNFLEPMDDFEVYQIPDDIIVTIRGIKYKLVKCD